MMTDPLPTCQSDQYKYFDIILIIFDQNTDLLPTCQGIARIEELSQQVTTFFFTQYLSQKFSPSYDNHHNHHLIINLMIIVIVE